MCTVTIIPLGGSLEGFRLACNRDELRSRPAALPPVERWFGARKALMPVDPAGSGTWVAVNDAGLAMALLNFNPGATGAVRGARESRGGVIPLLLHCDDVPAAEGQARRVVASRFQPFRLVLFDGKYLCEVTSDGVRSWSKVNEFDGRPVMFTSSGLGDALVEGPRRELFGQLLLHGQATPQRQDAFHAHRWEDRPHLSVCMSRADSRTVSRSVIEVGAGQVRMTYRANEDRVGSTVLGMGLVARSGRNSHDNHGQR
jgi:hypothetical protein